MHLRKVLCAVFVIDRNPEIWPLMTQRLRLILDGAHECERDYFRKNTCTDCKPEFWWLEEGLFSGGVEEAIPAQFRILKSELISDRTYRVRVRFTYRETFETYGRPPNPRNHFDWSGVVLVKCENNRCLIDDFVRVDPETSRPRFVLSAAFDGCDGPRWIGRTP